MIFNIIEDKNPKGEDQITPLHIAAKLDNLTIFQIIFDNIADKNPIDNGGFTPLYYAAKAGSQSICELMINSGQLMLLELPLI